MTSSSTCSIAGTRLTDIFVADGTTSTTFVAFIGTEDPANSIHKAQLTLSGSTMSITACQLVYYGDQVARMHVDTSLNRLYFFQRLGAASNGLVPGQHDLNYVDSRLNAQTTPSRRKIAQTPSINDHCYDVFVSDDIVWMVCEVNAALSSLRRVASNSAVASSSNNNFATMGSLSSGIPSGLNTISVYDPSPSSAVVPSAVALAGAFAALLGAHRSYR